ncbi:hypothetical protein AB2B41_13260 [Marimonas sp. MJW-29]|uniref:Translocase n=1 Tax=Sulfitobacter sediminis TaxID=3234186 RepID=A0ABV3RRA3_9RHOB
MLRSKIITAVGTLACAVGIGFVMQSSETARVHYGDKSDRIPAAEAPVLEGAGAKNAMLDVQEITLTSAEYEAGIALPATDAEVTTVATPPSELSEPEIPDGVVIPACDIVAQALPVAAAMVNLTLDAPCMPNERVTVHHNGMIFTETTTSDGALNLRIPALSRQAVFILAFANGDGAVAQTIVEELENFDRAVLQWKGNTGFQIHAREFGADYGSEGHIWEGAPGSVADAITGTHGMITRHGDTNAAEPLLAEVYSFPKGQNSRQGSISLSVETEVTAANCGLEVEAQSLEIRPGGQVRTQNLTLAVPDCEATGSFLVLNNLLQDLKLAGM